MKTSKSDFKYFVKRCKFWIDKFKLNNYNVYYQHKALENCNGKIYTNALDHVSTIVLSTEVCYDEFYTGITKDQFIDHIAKHEVIHLMLSKLSWYAQTRYIQEENLDEAEEELVIRLEGLIK